MPAFSFKKQFVEPIRQGAKCHTIRGERKDGRIPAKAGDTLYLYCGMRTKGCFKIFVGPLGDVTCTKVEPIWITLGVGNFVVIIDGCILDQSEREALARADGFKNFPEMMRFWEGRLPFKGYIIHWR